MGLNLIFLGCVTLGKILPSLSFYFLFVSSLISPLWYVHNLVSMMPAVGEKDAKVNPPSVVTHSATVAWPSDVPSSSA